jgi:hypothetical protein
MTIRPSVGASRRRRRALILIEAYSATPRLNTTGFNDVLYCSQGLRSAVALERSVPCIRRGGARLLATIGGPRMGFYPTPFG